MSESNHPWCSDVSRDAAIRAAEDAAGAERTPLPDHRDLPSVVAELRERVGRLESTMMPKSVSGSSGLRTERITLEITHDLDAPLGDWIVQVVDESLGLLETVRVVEEGV